MRKYLLLLTEDRGEQTIYRYDLGCFVLNDRRMGDDPGLPMRQAMQEIHPREKGKRPAGVFSVKEPKGLVKRGSRPEDGEIPIRSGKEARPVCIMNEAHSSLQGHANIRQEAKEMPTLVERGFNVGGSGVSRQDVGSWTDDHSKL